MLQNWAGWGCIASGLTCVSQPWFVKALDLTLVIENTSITLSFIPGATLAKLALIRCGVKVLSGSFLASTSVSDFQVEWLGLSRALCGI